jgi:hypothetical protein
MNNGNTLVLTSGTGSVVGDHARQDFQAELSAHEILFGAVCGIHLEPRPRPA